MLTAQAERLQRELVKLTSELDKLIDPEDIVQKLNVTWEQIKRGGLAELNSISMQVTTKLQGLEQSMARYVTYNHPLIEFTHYDKISEEINALIAFIREMALKFAALVKSLATKLKKAVADTAAAVLTRLSQLGMNMLQLAMNADPISLIGVDAKSKLNSVHPMLWDLVESYSANGSEKLKEGVNSGILSAADLVREAEKTVLATADEYTKKASDLANKVKSSTPGPRTVRAGVRLALKDNAFDVGQRRFVARGSSRLRRIGLHAPTTRMVNTIANKAISAGENKAKSFALLHLQGVISNVLQKKRVPAQIAEKAAGMLVGALA